MYALNFMICGVLPYMAGAIFVAGMGHRLLGWRFTPRPSTMMLFPAPSDSLWRTVVAEAFLWPSLFRGDRLLWLTSWPFHCALALVLVGHIRAFSGLADALPPALGMTSGGIETASSVLGGAAGIPLLGTTALLLARRIVLGRVREISGFDDYFSLLLLLSVFVTGELMRADSSIYITSTRAWARSLADLSPAVPERPLLTMHLLCVELLVAYIPFSKMMHFGGIFFSRALLRRG